MPRKPQEKYTEQGMRRKFRAEAQKDPKLLLGQYVAMNLSGPGYRVESIINLSKPENVPVYALKLYNYKGKVFTWDPATSTTKVIEGAVYLDRVNYFAADLIAMYTQRIESLTKNVDD